MPIQVDRDAPTIFIRRDAYERAGLVRSSIDDLLGLTDAEFRVEGDVVAIGPIYQTEAISDFFALLDGAGLEYYEDYFELSGNWPAWLSVLVGTAGGGGRSKPSQPQR